MSVSRVLARRLVLAAWWGLVLATSVPARAALFDDTEARQRIDATNQRIDQMRRVLDERIAALETQMRNQGLVDIFNQIEQLKRDVAQLRGQLEVITYELGEAQKRQRDLYVDLDSRMRRIETASAAGVGSATPGPTAEPSGIGTSATPGATASFGPPPPAGAGGVSGSLPAPRAGGGETAAEQRAYDAALDLFKSGNYGAAVQSFAAFIRANPRSSLAPSAQYWIGNAQFAMRDFRAAITSQRQLVANYPESQKVPDALLNIATSQFELGDSAQSRRSLEDLITRYPQSDAASKARQRISGR
ncbi:MAG: tol-pal system protein YbgF [Pseudomonadota bacterium]|nr:tol-pal system protein YbgF [Pseudomonadota bacterium]